MSDSTWPDRYARDGYVIIKGLIDPEFCATALERVKELVGNGLPLHEWTTANAPILYRPFVKGFTPTEPVFEALFDQPRLLEVLNTMMGGRWNGDRNCYLFLKPYQPDAEAKLAPGGHVDFPGQIIPILYRGMSFQVSLIESEPFSGNITFFPGTHITVQKTLMENPEMELKELMATLPLPEPVEFIAEPGDVAFYHHLLMHEGNHSHAANRTPRVALTGEVFCDKWLESVDPENPNLSPWERSLAWNGAYEETNHQVEALAMEKRRGYFEGLREKSVG